MKASIKQISQMTGFSPATVSNALNRKKGVNEETSRKIFKVAEELGYQTEKTITKIKFVTYRKNGRIIEDVYKRQIVQAIAEDVKDAASVVLVDYRGLTVAQDTELRKQLRDAGIVYKVCKNTMMKRAFEGTELAALEEHLEGPSAIAISKDDATAPARILCKFAKDAKALELKAGVIEGTDVYKRQI